MGLSRDYPAAPAADLDPVLDPQGPLGFHLNPDGTGDIRVFAPNAQSMLVELSDDGLHTSRQVPLRDVGAGLWAARIDQVAAGQRYGLRAHGPWDPANGHRFNPHKRLIDPYARALDREVSLDASHFAHQVNPDFSPVDGPARLLGARLVSDLETSAGMPWGLVTDTCRFDTGPRPQVDPASRVVYEAHVKGLTMTHPGVPDHVRGTYAGFAHPAVLEHLSSLGVTTIELLPVYAIGDEPALIHRGQRNYWGYSTLNYFAPATRYATLDARETSPVAVLAEFADMVRALHEAGFEVVLDVVYNHTAEGGIDGPTYSFRGLDASSYYRLGPDGLDDDVTGCGGSLDFRHPRVVQLTLDSLRYWCNTFGIDGFRFDLATTLARGPHDYDPDHPFLVALRSDPVLSQRLLIAEPWDIGPQGWRTGQFPPPFAEWNDRFRDDVRQFWVADAGDTFMERGLHGSGVRNLATRLAGSADHFGVSASIDRVMRGPLASINFITAHDGFTLHDLVSYNHRRNEANGENNADGSGNNLSWNHGVEGESTDPAVVSERHRTMRAMLGSLLLATGVPMLTAGDEWGHTQNGNNNPYCQDNDLGWVQWPPPGEQGLTEHLKATTGHLIRLRNSLPGMRQRHFFAGREQHDDGTTDLAWFTQHANPMDITHWQDTQVRSLQMFLHGNHLDGPCDDDEATLILINGSPDEQLFSLPGLPWAQSYTLLWDSALEHDTFPQMCANTAQVTVGHRSMQVYRATTRVPAP